MIILIPIVLYLVIVISLIWVSNFLFKAKTQTFRKILKRRIVGISVVLFFSLGFLYFFYLFGLAFDNHYDVKKRTLLWYATMDNETITDFPVFEPAGKVIFNSIGGDSPSIGTGWEIEYTSKIEIGTLTKKNIEYLKSEGYEIISVNETQYYYRGKYNKNEMNELYSGSSVKGGGLDLLLQRKKTG